MCNVRTLTDKKVPLHGAACFGHATCLQLLLKNGADPRIGDVTLTCPIHLAAFVVSAFACACAWRWRWQCLKRHTSPRRDTSLNSSRSASTFSSAASTA
jgi:hypothetical protein